MKKIYALFVLLCAFTLSAQPYTETFDNYVHPGTAANSYQNSSFIGVQSINWATVHVTGQQDFPIDGAGILLRRNDEPSSITATFSNGLSQLSFQYKKAFSANGERKLDVIINGDVVASTPSFGTTTTDTETYTFTLTEAQLAPFNQNESLTLSIQVSASLPAGNRQIVVDNVVWAPFSETTPTEPVYVTSVNALSDFEYAFGTGPSESQSFVLTVSEEVSEDVILTVSESYEISLDEEGEYTSSITLESYNGEAQTVYVRLQAGLEIGDYTGSVSIVEGVSVALSGSVVEPVSINEFEASIRIYPNPASDVINVSYEGVADFTLEVYNISGQRILSQKGQVMNVSQLQSGVYLLNISNETQTVTKKIVKK